jgi:hypothetical protein
MSIAIEGSPFAAKYKFFVIPNEQREEESPNAANRPTRFLPVVEMTTQTVDMTIWIGRHTGAIDDNRGRSI